MRANAVKLNQSAEVGFAGNELVAMIRIQIRRRIGSDAASTVQVAAKRAKGAMNTPPP